MKPQSPPPPPPRDPLEFTEIRGGSPQPEEYYTKDPNLVRPEHPPQAVREPLLSQLLAYLVVFGVLLVVGLNWGFLRVGPQIGGSKEGESLFDKPRVRAELRRMLEARAIIAPELEGAVAWLNTGGASLRLAGELRGRMVLLDFWTSSCINCHHFIAGLKKIEERFSGRPVVFIGVHSPAFDYEQDPQVVEEAVRRMGIRHPVAVDSRFAIWRAYHIRAWPTAVLISPDGKVIKVWLGEGNYDEIEALIEEGLNYFGEQGLLADSPLPLESLALGRKVEELAYPGKVEVDQRGGRIFISDSGHNRIVVTDLAGNALAVIGSGQVGREDGKFAEASFNRPQGLAYDPEEDQLYIADTGNHLIRRADLRRRVVETVAGTGRQLMGPGRGGDDPLKVEITSPWDLVLVDQPQGRFLYIAMAGNHTIWRLNLSTNRLEHYAGSSLEGRVDGERRFAEFAQPSGITYLDGALYVADSEVNAVRKIDLASGRVTTLAGGYYQEYGDRDGVGNEARFTHPLGIVAGEGVLYLADTFNQKIKRIDPATGKVISLAGSGSIGELDGGFERARFFEPSGLAWLGGKLLVADTNNHRIRLLDLERKEVSSLTVKGIGRILPHSSPVVSGSYPRQDEVSEKPGQRFERVSVNLFEGRSINLQLDLKLPPGYHFYRDVPLKVTFYSEEPGVNFSRQVLEVPYHHIHDVSMVSVIPTCLPEPGRSCKFVVKVDVYYCKNGSNPGPASCAHQELTFPVEAHVVDDPKQADEKLRLTAELPPV